MLIVNKRIDFANSAIVICRLFNFVSRNPDRVDSGLSNESWIARALCHANACTSAYTVQWRVTKKAKAEHCRASPLQHCSDAGWSCHWL